MCSNKQRTRTKRHLRYVISSIHMILNRTSKLDQLVVSTSADQLEGVFGEMRRWYARQAHVGEPAAVTRTKLIIAPPTGELLTQTPIRAFGQPHFRRNLHFAHLLPVLIYAIAQISKIQVNFKSLLSGTLRDNRLFFSTDRFSGFELLLIIRLLT
jgi:hypothetical protein